LRHSFLACGQLRSGDQLPSRSDILSVSRVRRSASARQTWATFIRIHLALLAGTDFFTAEVLTLRGLVTYYVLFFIHLESRRVDIAGITVHPDERWMQQIARNVTMERCGELRNCRYLCMIATPSTANPSGRLSRQAGSNHWCCLPQSEPECLCGALG
jgi:hypothetical protein